MTSAVPVLKRGVPPALLHQRDRDLSGKYIGGQGGVAPALDQPLPKIGKAVPDLVEVHRTSVPAGGSRPTSNSETNSSPCRRWPVQRRRCARLSDASSAGKVEAALRREGRLR